MRGIAPDDPNIGSRTGSGDGAVLGGALGTLIGLRPALTVLAVAFGFIAVWVIRSRVFVAATVTTAAGRRTASGWSIANDGRAGADR